MKNKKVTKYNVYNIVYKVDIAFKFALKFEQLFNLLKFFSNRKYYSKLSHSI